MNEIDNELENVEEKEEGGLRNGLSGLGQKILGEIETIGGVLTGDPITQAEGEFNVEVGDIREDIEEDLEESDTHRRGTEMRNEKE